MKKTDKKGRYDRVIKIEKHNEEDTEADVFDDVFGEKTGAYDLYHLMFDDKKITKIVLADCGDKDPTFEDMLDLAKENGYKKGALMLICESATNGIIYMYGNAGDFWYEYGKTIGYA